METDGHLGCCHFKGREGGAANVIRKIVGRTASDDGAHQAVRL